MFHTLLKHWTNRRGGRTANPTGRDRRLRPAVEQPESRCVPSITLDPISNVSVPGGKTLFVPVTATSTSPVTYSVQSSNPQVTAILHTGDPFLQIIPTGTGNPAIDGQPIVIQLFPENAPNNVQRFISTVNSGFYNGLSFYRLVPGFVIQGGNKTGTEQNFPDEYAASSIFTAPGTLAYANSGDNTNDTEVFITTTTSNNAEVLQQRALDFNFTVLGKVVRGQSVVDAISNQPAVGQQATPPITIQSAQVISDTADNTLTVSAPLGQSATITVFANNGTDPVASQSFTATAVADIYNDPPFLVRPLPTPSITAGTPVTFTLPAVDLEGDPMTFEAILQGTSANNASVSVSGNQVTVTPHAGFVGNLSLLVGVMQTGATTRGNDNVLFDTALMTVTVNPAPPPVAIVATGADLGAAPQVNVYNAGNGALVASFLAFPAGFTGGVRVAVGDVNGDGQPDVIAGAGPGAFPQVNVYDGKTFQLIRSFLAWPSSFSGGVFVAAGDVNGDGLADIVVGADSGFPSALSSQNTGSLPEVKVFSGAASNALLLDFYAFPLTFRGGVRVAAGDVNGDGKADVIVGAGPGGLPQVSVFDGTSGAVLEAFFAFSSSFTGGVYVAAKDVTGGGHADIIAGQGAGGSPLVNTFDSATLAQLDSFQAFPSGFSGGVRVGAGRPGSRIAVLAAAGPGGLPQVSAFDSNNTVLASFFAYPQAFTGGVFVAGGE